MRRPTISPALNIAIALPDRGSGQLLHALHRQLRTAIADGRLQPGLRLPPTRALADDLGISRNTAIAAYDMLLSEGYVEGRTGAGTFVAEILPQPVRRTAPVPDMPSCRSLAPQWRTAVPPPAGTDHRFAFDFLSGFPDTRAFPFDIWQRLCARSARSIAKVPPAEGDPAGEAPLRQAIAAHVSFVRAVACTAEDVVVTAGARQAIDLLARILVTPGETEVALEEPGYGPTRRSFIAAGAKILAVPVDDEGLVVERLPPTVRIVCVTPSHQFPLGIAMSARRRAALLDFARRAGAIVIEDDYDSEFRHEARPLDALQSLDRSGSVFYVGTFSKSMFPALRLGFVVAPAWARDALVTAKHLNDWHCPTIPQMALADFIASGHLARHIRRMRRTYTERQRTLTQALAEHFGARLRVLRAPAGVHLAAELASPGDAQALVAAAAAKGIRVEYLARRAADGSARGCIVFGYGLIEAAEIGRAIPQLAGLPA